MEAKQLRLEQFEVPRVDTVSVGFKGTVEMPEDDFPFVTGLRLGQRFDLTCTVQVVGRVFLKPKGEIQTKAGLEVLSFVVPDQETLRRISEMLADMEDDDSE